MNRSESRYFATAARMDEAFLNLLAKKDFEYITIKEICEVAGVIKCQDRMYKKYYIKMYS